MVNQSKGLLHYSRRRRAAQIAKGDGHLKKFYDKFMFVIVIAAPLANLPQLLKVWVDKSAVGVSAISWFFFSIISVTWLIYGIIHKDKHIIIMDVLLIIVQTLIAVGAVIYG